MSAVRLHSLPVARQFRIIFAMIPESKAPFVQLRIFRIIVQIEIAFLKSKILVHKYFYPIVVRSIAK